MRGPTRCKHTSWLLDHAVASANVKDDVQVARTFPPPPREADRGWETERTCRFGACTLALVQYRSVVDSGTPVTLG
eukprot:scaffold121796_cov54-Phaeocystis_antarctica.AAC.2